jgi:hypothetical protein
MAREEGVSPHPVASVRLLETTESDQYSGTMAG